MTVLTVVPAKGAETAAAVLAQITAHPETHDQSNWERVEFCGTTRCVAGWAAVLHGATEVEHRQTPYMKALGAELFAISEDDAEKLFFDTTDDEAIEALRYLANGTDIDWDVVNPSGPFEDDE